MSLDLYQDELNAVDAGFLNRSVSYKKDTYGTFEDGLIVGRFAKLDSGSLDNLDNSSTPVIAGVVEYDPANAIENGTTFTPTGEGAIHQVNAISYGMVTVDVVSGDTPAKFGAVYAVNASGSGADFGKATTTSTDNVQVAGYFNREIKTGVWEIFVQITGA